MKFAEIDLWILHKIFIPLTEVLNSKFGWNPYRVAANLFLADAAFHFPRAWLEYQSADYGLVSLTFFSAVVSMVYGVRANSFANRPTQSGYAYWLVTLLPLRIVFAVSMPIVLMVYALVGFWHGFVNILATLPFPVACYFLACPLPPPAKRTQISANLQGAL